LWGARGESRIRQDATSDRLLFSVKPMRVVFVTSGLARGGAEAQLIAMSRELLKRGHAVAIYTLNREVDRLPELEGSGVMVQVDQKKWKVDIALLSRLVGYIKRFRADIVQGFLYDGNFYGRLAARLAGVPALDSERNDNYRLNQFQRMGELVSRHLARAVVANSRSGGRFAQKLYGFPAERIHVVWNGINLQAVDQRVRSCQTQKYMQVFFGAGHGPVAVLVGNIKPQKDYKLALAVAHELMVRAPEWRILFLGDDIRESGGYKGEILELHARLPNRDRIVFGGRRPDAIEIVSQCDVLFSTSRHEGFPNVVLEAMAVGVPVVSTEYSDIKDILPLPWQVVPSRDPGQLAEAILRAHGEAEGIARAQRTWVERHATVEASADALGRVYEQYLPT